MAAAVGATHRLPGAARLGVARRNSLRSLRELRSDSRRESDNEARCARRPRGCAARRRRHHLAAPGRACLGPTGPALAPARRRLPLGQGRRCSDEDPVDRRERDNVAGKGEGRSLPARLVRSREAQQCRPARAARVVLLTRGDCPSAAGAARAASFAARPALRASQGTPAQRGPAPARRRRAAHAFARARARAFARTNRGTRAGEPG